MEKINTPYYDMNRPIDDGGSELSKVLNRILSKCNLQRIVSAPKAFDDLDTDYVASMLYMFYTSILEEKLLYEIINKLHSWTDALDEYFDEFEGNWKYYASSKRLEYLNEYGGEAKDYDEDGTIKTEGLDNDYYKFHTILSELIMEGIRDIVIDTKDEDLMCFMTSLGLDSTISITDYFKSIGHNEIMPYKMTEDEEGNPKLVKMTQEDIELGKISRMVDSDDLFATLVYVFKTIREMYGKLKKLNPYEDNVEELSQVRKTCLSLLNCAFSLKEP